MTPEQLLCPVMPLWAESVPVGTWSLGGIVGVNQGRLLGGNDIEPGSRSLLSQPWWFLGIRQREGRAAPPGHAQARHSHRLPAGGEGISEDGTGKVGHACGQGCVEALVGGAFGTVWSHNRWGPGVQCRQTDELVLDFKKVPVAFGGGEWSRC